VIAVVDSSPLIVLAKSGYLGLLPQLFDTILMPPAVFAEITAQPRRAGAEQIAELAWLRLTSVRDHTRLDRLRRRLDPGEAEVIALGEEVTAHMVVLDDLPGRREAAARGLTIVGTAGLAVMAKREGLVPLARPLIDDFIRAGLFLRSDLYQGLIQTANE